MALYKKITTDQDLNTIKIMELGSGNKIDRWKTFIKINKKLKWKVILTDFEKTLLPLQIKNSSDNLDNFTFKTKIHNLFSKFPKMKSGDRHDVVLSTYTFDSLWLKDDLHLIKIDNIWYKNLYQLDISKVKRKIIQIKKGKKLNQLFFKNLKIKTLRTKIDLPSIKYGSYIYKYYKDQKCLSVNFPGGLINTVLNCFNNNLNKEGIFITADIATAGINKKAKGFKSVNGTIKIKVENWKLAKYILEKLGFYVELKNLYEFIEKAKIITPVKIYDHFVLSVKKLPSTKVDKGRYIPNQIYGS
jgi:hypothetical protein